MWTDYIVKFNAYYGRMKIFKSYIDMKLIKDAILEIFPIQNIISIIE